MFTHIKILKNEVNIREFKYSVLQPRSECIQLFNYAKSLRKTIILVCEKNFYFGKLPNLLEKKGFNGWKAIYILNTANNKFFKQLNSSFKKIFFIGNYSNFTIRKNFDCFHISPYLDSLLAKEPKCRKYYTENKDDITASVFLGLMSLNVLQHNNSYWYNFGYIFMLHRYFIHMSNGL